ncbi:MAG: DnaA/Hda family protein [Acidimicrobiales bacterium]
MGLITDIQPPDLETCLAVLGKKAEGEPIPVPDEVLELIATNITENILRARGCAEPASPPWPASTSGPSPSRRPSATSTTCWATASPDRSPPR